MQIVTVKELSQILKVKEKTLYQWAESRKIPCLKLNGVLRFDLNEIKVWMETCKKAPSGGYNSFAQIARSEVPERG